MEIMLTENDVVTKAKNQNESGNINGAIKTLDDYLRANPYSTRPRLLLAQYYELSRKHELAMFHLEIIIDLEPENLDARKAYVTILKQKSMYTKEAKEQFDYLVEHDPNNADLINSYAIFAKLQLTDNAKCEELYRRAIELSPNNADYHLNYAILLVSELKRYEDGRAELEKAIALDPSNKRAVDAYERLIKKKFNGDKPKKSLLDKIKRR